MIRNQRMLPRMNRLRRCIRGRRLLRMGIRGELMMSLSFEEGVFLFVCNKRAKLFFVVNLAEVIKMVIQKRAGLVYSPSITAVADKLPSNLGRVTRLRPIKPTYFPTSLPSCTLYSGLTESSTIYSTRLPLPWNLTTKKTHKENQRTHPRPRSNHSRITQIPSRRLFKYTSPYFSNLEYPQDVLLTDSEESEREEYGLQELFISPAFQLLNKPKVIVTFSKVLIYTRNGLPVERFLQRGNLSVGNSILLRFGMVEGNQRHKELIWN